MCWQHNNTSGLQTPFPGTFPEVACAEPGTGPGALPDAEGIHVSDNWELGGSHSEVAPAVINPSDRDPPTHTFSKGCWGPWCAPDAAPRVLSTGVASQRPLTRYQEEEGRRGRKGTNGCSRPHQKGPLTWDLAARSGGRSTRSLRSFRACAPTGAAILSRKPARGSS